MFNQSCCSTSRISSTADQCPINGHSFVHGVNVIHIKAKLKFRIFIFTPKIHIRTSSRASASLARLQPATNDRRVHQHQDIREMSGHVTDKFFLRLYSMLSYCFPVFSCMLDVILRTGESPFCDVTPILARYQPPRITKISIALK
jgi:hypothetical protein